MRVLVAFASEKGGTAEIAEAIGQELRQLGMETDVQPVDGVRDLSPYGAVLLGSAVYFGKWRKPALKFGARHANELAGKPVWLFESGPTDTTADEGKAPPVKSAVELAQQLHARGHVTFGGRFLPEQAGRFTRKLIESGQGGASFGDYRNFDRIRAWARQVGAELQGAPLVAAQ